MSKRLFAFMILFPFFWGKAQTAQSEAMEKQFTKDTVAIEKAIQKSMEDFAEGKGNLQETPFEYGAKRYKALMQTYYAKLLSLAIIPAEKASIQKWHSTWKLYNDLNFTVRHPAGLQHSTTDLAVNEWEGNKQHCVDIVDCISRYYNRE